MHKTKKSSVEMNSLQAAVLGANDGIVSVAGLVVGVAGNGQSRLAILITGIAGIVAGAMSMAVGEYGSVCAERDLQKAILDKEKQALISHPKKEFDDLVRVYEDDGLTKNEAVGVAKELSAADALKVHADVDYQINPKKLVNPWTSAAAAALAFILGAVIPVLAVIVPVKCNAAIPIFVAVVLALTLTGALSAKISGAKTIRSIARVVAGGVIAMLVTYIVGNFFHTAGV